MIKYGIEAMTKGDGNTVLLTVGKEMDAPLPKCDLFEIKFLIMRVLYKFEVTDLEAIVQDLNARGVSPLDVYAGSLDELRLASRLKHVKYLTLAARDINSKHTLMLTQFARMESLQITASLPEDVLSAACAAAGECPLLTDVYFDSSIATDACMQGLSQSSSIKELIVRTTRVNVTDIGMKCLGQLKTLTRLRLESPKITSEGLRHLESLPALRNLRLHDEQGVVLRAGIDALLAANPKCEIVCGSEKFKAKAAARAAKSTAPKNPKPLSAKVWKEIERLGGKKRAIRENADGLPLPIEEFAHGIAWPKRKYSATLDLDGPFPVQDINFNVSGGTDEIAAFPSCEGRSLVKVGEASSCYYIALDFKSKNLSDPTLEMFDCEDFDEECMYHTQPLSKFLARLKAD